MKDTRTGRTLGVYFSASTLEAGRVYARKTSVPFSRIVENALQDYLTAHGALPGDEEVEYEANCAAIRELEGGPQALKELLIELTTQEVAEAAK